MPNKISRPIAIGVHLMGISRFRQLSRNRNTTAQNGKIYMQWSKMMFWSGVICVDETAATCRRKFDDGFYQRAEGCRSHAILVVGDLANLITIFLFFFERFLIITLAARHIL